MKTSYWTAIRAAACISSVLFLSNSHYAAAGAGGWQIENSQPILSFDFEDSQACNDAWSFELDDVSRVWHCGQVTTGPRAGVFGSHGAMFASTLGAPGPLAGTLLSNPIQLPQGPSYLSFESWNDFETSDLGMSGGRVLIFVDDVSSPLRPLDGYADPENKFSVTDLGAQRHWRHLLFDLTPYGGMTIRIGLEAVGLAADPGAGWFLDNVEVGLGQVSKVKSDYRLMACQAGPVLRFNFSECLDDWEAQSDSSTPVWHCAPPSLDPDPAVPPGPRGDSPAYFKDGSRRLIATEPGGAYPPGVVATLTSPEIQLAACSGRTFLSFWHWYHFAPGDGGYVELWDSQQWSRLTPVGGYPGQVTDTSLGKAINGYASNQDTPSGWRRAVFNLTPYLSNKKAQKIKVRFVFASARGRASRPGWYVDTIEFGRALEFSNGPVDCNQPAFDLGKFDPNPELPKDPCLEGLLVAPSRVVVAPSEQGGGRPSDNPNSVDGPLLFQTQKPGWICVQIERGTAEGSLLAEGMSLMIDGKPVALTVATDETQIRHRAALAAGGHSVQLTVRRGLASYGVLFAEDAKGPLPIPSLVHKTPKLRVQNLRMFAAQANQGLRARITGQFLLPYPQAVPGLGELTAVYQLRLIRADNCREVMRINGRAAFDSNSHIGMGERIAFFTTDFNRLEELGVPLFLFLEFGAIECLDFPGTPPPDDVDWLGTSGLPGELEEIRESVLALIPASHWRFDFDWFSPAISSPFWDGTYTDEVPLGGEISFADANAETVFPTDGTRVDLFVTQESMSIPITPTRIPVGSRGYFNIQIPVSLDPGEAQFHLTHDGREVLGSPGALSILAPGVASVSNATVCAGETVQLNVRNITSRLLASGQLTGELTNGPSGPGAPVESIAAAMVDGSEVESLDVRLPNSAEFVPGTYHLLIKRNGVTVPGGNRPMTLGEPSIDRIQRLTDYPRDRRAWMRPGDRIRIEGECLSVAAYGESLVRLRREGEGTPTDLHPTMSDPRALVVDLPTDLAFGRYMVTVEFSVGPGGAPPVPMVVRGRMDGPFTLIPINAFTTPMEEQDVSCASSTGRRWVLHTGRTGRIPNEYRYTVFEVLSDPDRRLEVPGGTGTFEVGPTGAGGVQLIGDCRLLLVVNRPDTDGDPDTSRHWRFNGFYYHATENRFVEVGALRPDTDLPDVSERVRQGFFLVAPDGSVVVRGLWQPSDNDMSTHADENTIFTIVDAFSDDNRCPLISGFCDPLYCPDCGGGRWSANILGNRLVLLGLNLDPDRHPAREGPTGYWVGDLDDRPRPLHGPVDLPSSGDPD